MFPRRSFPRGRTSGHCCYGSQGAIGKREAAVLRFARFTFAGSLPFCLSLPSPLVPQIMSPEFCAENQEKRYIFIMDWWHLVSLAIRWLCLTVAPLASLSTRPWCLKKFTGAFHPFHSQMRNLSASMWTRQIPRLDLLPSVGSVVKIYCPGTKTILLFKLALLRWSCLDSLATCVSASLSDLFLNFYSIFIFY